MNLPAFCIRRPAFTIVMSLIMVIIGLIGFMNLPVRWVPNINLPVVNIETSYPGANAKIVEQDVTKVIEGTLSGINSVESLTSTTRNGDSQIMLTFKLGRDMDAAVADVRSSLERVRGALPKDAQNPIVMKSDPNSSPTMFLSFYDERLSARELSDYVTKYIVPVFETIDGVGSVQVYGNSPSIMHIKLDPAKLAGAKIPVEEVTQLLQAQNASIPSGQIRGYDRFYSVVTDTALKTPEQFNDLIIRDNQNQVVRLRDIGEASLDSKDNDSAFRINGKPGIALGIVPQSIANPLDVESSVQREFAKLKRSLPTSMQADIVYNQATYIRASITSVYEAFFEAVIFVWLVILMFLCNFRATWIPIITIPVCMISTFALLYFLGFSINTITLMAFVLAIGLVVDDAIVMLENINRHIEEGMTPFNAALKGSKEIIFPIIAMTLTLAAVYAPITFTPGLLGVLFREFTFTLAGAVIVSGFVALTLSPMMCARLLRPINEVSRYGKWFNLQLAHLQQFYRRLLTLVLRKRLLVVLGLLVIATIGMGVYRYLPSELAPAEDMSEIDIFIGAPKSASFQYTDNYVREVETLFQGVPDINSYVSISGMSSSPSHAFQLLFMKPKNQRKKSLEETIAALTAKANLISGVRVHLSQPPPALTQFTGDEGDNLGLVITTSSNNYRKLQQVSEHVMDEIKKNALFERAQNRLKWDSEQFSISVDRDRAADLKVAIPSISSTISTLLAGKNVGKTDDADIIVQLNDAALANPNIFQQMYVLNDNGNMVSLSNVINVKTGTEPEVFRHVDRLAADTIYLSLAPNVKLSDAINALEKIARSTVPDDMKYSFTGEAKSFLDSIGKTLLTFGLALVFIYLVLVAQFESFIDPLIIMLTVPFAIVGALLTLLLFDGSLNIYSNIGMITLVGLIAKHGILITEFANRLRTTGKSVQDAVVEAALLRLRPILMTTAAMILGALPLAFAFGPGSESRQQIGLVITGGLLFGTFFSLIIVPIVYTYLAPFRKIAVSSGQDENYATAL